MMGETHNYASATDNPEDSAVELRRLMDLCYAIPMSKQEVRDRGYKEKTVSKLGLIVKPKPDGGEKRRVIIDLRRSGGNDKAELPERLILPRPQDAGSKRLQIAFGAVPVNRQKDLWVATGELCAWEMRNFLRTA